MVAGHQITAPYSSIKRTNEQKSTFKEVDSLKSIDILSMNPSIFIALQEIMFKWALNLRQWSNVTPKSFIDSPAESRSIPDIE